MVQRYADIVEALEQTLLAGLPGVRRMYSSARSTRARRALSATLAGFGIHASIGEQSSGLVPQLTIGASADASKLMSRSKRASSSLGKPRQKVTASS